MHEMMYLLQYHNLRNMIFLTQAYYLYRIGIMRLLKLSTKQIYPYLLVLKCDYLIKVYVIQRFDVIVHSRSNILLIHLIPKTF